MSSSSPTVVLDDDENTKNASLLSTMKHLFTISDEIETINSNDQFETSIESNKDDNEG